MPIDRPLPDENEDAARLPADDDPRVAQFLTALKGAQAAPAAVATPARSTPARQGPEQTAAVTQPGNPGRALPDMGDGLIPPDRAAAMNATELAQQGRGAELRQFLDRSTTAQAVDAGLKDIVAFFGLKSQGAVPTAVPQEAYARMAQGEGAMTPDEVEQLQSIVDPNQALRDDARLIAAMNAQYQYFMRKGQPDKAAAMQRGILLHIRQVVARGGALAQVALEDGNLGAAAKAIAESYSLIPDGQSLQITGVDRGGVRYSLVDDETGELTHQGKATVNQLMYLATGMQNGSLWFEQMSGIALRAAQTRRLIARQDAADARSERAEERAVRAEDRAVQSQERAERRFAAQETDRQRRREFLDKRGDARQQWAGHAETLGAIKADLQKAREAGDQEGIAKLEEEWKQARQAAADFIKSSPEAALNEPAFRSLTREGYAGPRRAGGATQPGNRASGGPSLEDRMTNPDLTSGIDAEVGRILPKASEDQRVRARRLVTGLMKANDDLTPADAGRFMHHALAGTEGVQLGEDSLTVPGLGTIAISKATYLDLKEMAAAAARTRAKAAAGTGAPRSFKSAVGAGISDAITNAGPNQERGLAAARAQDEKKKQLARERRAAQPNLQP